VLKLAWRFLSEPDPRLVRIFLSNMCWKGARSLRLHERRLRRGEFFPPFLFISLTNNCNLSCQGCWVTRSDPPAELPAEALDRIISGAAARGCSFFGLLGGEPLLYGPLFDVIGRHPECYFQVFTNGSLLDGAAAAEMRRLGNVTPLVSVEGLGAIADERRGGVNVFDGAMGALEACRKQRLITGVATSVCASNFDDLVSADFINRLVGMGVLYLWYYIYRPAGARPCPELALMGAQIAALRSFIVNERSRRPIALVDSYWDHLGRALCPAAMGVSHHINPRGDIEPCPPIQFSRDKVGDGTRLFETFDTSSFLRHFRQVAARKRGCILLEDPGALSAFLKAEGAADTSGRKVGLDELEHASRHAGHDMTGAEIPERNFFYRAAKKRWFFGFGAYG